MKIICIGRNYLAHVAEMDRELPKEPLFFMKPATALVGPNQPFRYPDFSKEVHFETELVLRIGQTGHAIAEAEASRYYDAITVGIDFTARDLQRRCIEKGQPWEMAKSFDQSAPVGVFKDFHQLKDPGQIGFGMRLNGQWAQQGDSRDLIFSFDRLVSHVSRFVTLEAGDLVFTGTPRGVGSVQVGDRLELFLEGERVSAFDVI
ncbi:MAG: fumarylacetoacetate hydrolase family protein [Bacteroidales bacterium]|nr:fumarylacetoacetate hydrolase family protein [Bacteroidales bacterium]